MTLTAAPKDAGGVISYSRAKIITSLAHWRDITLAHSGHCDRFGMREAMLDEIFREYQVHRTFSTVLVFMFRGHFIGRYIGLIFLPRATRPVIMCIMKGLLYEDSVANVSYASNQDLPSSLPPSLSSLLYTSFLS